MTPDIDRRLAANDERICALEDLYDCGVDDIGLTPRDYDEIYAAERAVYDAQQRKALRQLWRPEAAADRHGKRTAGWGELLEERPWGWPWWLREGRWVKPVNRLMVRLHVSVLILRGRWGEPQHDHYGTEVCWWDYTHDGYFWSCWQLRLHKGGWVSVSTEGDGESPY